MNTKTIIALALAGSLCLGLCACGDSEHPTDKPAATKTTQNTTQTTEDTQPVGEAETKTWGDWTVDVPAGFELVGKGFVDENDPRYFGVEKSIFYYFDFSADGEAEIMRNYEYNKKTYTNEQEDMSGSFGGNEWTGFQYSDGFGGYGFEAYTTIDGEMIRVASVGFRFDSEMAEAVLSSLKHTPRTESAATAEATESTGNN